jgi:type II secretory ATPase GspE/PulE/Tfp pilus assembly ATPase PilB-like protein
VSALTRLRDLGVPSYLITSSVAGIISQRMMRVVCSACQLMMKGSPSEQEAYAAVMGESRESFINGSGCNICARTGYHGRTGVFETLTISDRMRQMFLADAPRHELFAQAVEDGMVPLRQGAMMKVKQGITTPYEVLRILFSLE